MLSEPLRVVARLATTFDSLSIPYVICGSLASSLYGIPRSTQDVDLVADIQPSQVEALVASLGEEFYADAEMIRDAIRRRSSFNVIHLATMFKADIFSLQEDAWSQTEMSRAKLQPVEAQGKSQALRFATPEDTLLHKLVWYQLGNQSSDRQWGDILGILQIQGDLLDAEYLNRWTRHLDVAELLRRARES